MSHSAERTFMLNLVAHGCEGTDSDCDQNKSARVTDSWRGRRGCV